MIKISRSQILFAVIALILAFVQVRGLVKMPAYTDAYYHFNVANRLAKGEGFVDDFLWTYIGAPDELPAPSNLYWMPMTSIIASAGMSLFNAPNDYASAQFFFVLLVAGAGIVAYRLALMLDGTFRHAWIAGLLTILGGFFAARWGTMDTFAPYALIGSLALLFIGLGMSAKQRNGLYWILAGVFAGLGHLTRADGLILLLTAWAVLLFPFDFLHGNFKDLIRRRLVWLVLVTVFYIVTMTPWFMRNLNEIGSILPVGGTQSIWFTEYNDLFSYPPDASPSLLFADGLSTFLASRWTAFTSNLGTFIAVEGMVIIAPLMLIGLWKRRHNLLLRGMWIFAIGIHFAMTVVFPFPGFRGGLWHAVAALVPFWMVLGMLGLDDVIDWIAKRRRTWNAPTAKIIFSIMLLFFGIIFTNMIASKAKVGVGGLGRVYTGLQELLPSDARVMINDPAQLYYWLGMGGVTLPNESVEIVPIIAKQYDIDYLFLEFVGDDDGFIKAAPLDFQFDANNPPDFLEPIPFPNRKDVRLYAIITD